MPSGLERQSRADEADRCEEDEVAGKRVGLTDPLTRRSPKLQASEYHPCPGAGRAPRAIESDGCPEACRRSAREVSGALAAVPTRAGRSRRQEFSRHGDPLHAQRDGEKGGVGKYLENLA